MLIASKRVSLLVRTRVRTRVKSFPVPGRTWEKGNPRVADVLVTRYFSPAIIENILSVFFSACSFEASIFRVAFRIRNRIALHCDERAAALYCFGNENFIQKHVYFFIHTPRKFGMDKYLLGFNLHCNIWRE